MRLTLCLLIALVPGGVVSLSTRRHIPSHVDRTLFASERDASNFNDVNCTNQYEVEQIKNEAHEFETCIPNLPSLDCSCALDVPIFAISQPTSSRRHTLTAQLEQICPSNCPRAHMEFVDAINRSNWTEISLSTNFTEAAWNRGPADPYSGRQISSWCSHNVNWCIANKGEIAVATSHLKAIWRAHDVLQHLPEGVPRVALVVEDDVDMSPVRYWRHRTLLTWLKNANLPENWTAVQLFRGSMFNGTKEVFRVNVDQTSDIAIRRDPLKVFGAVATLYSWHGIRTILKATLLDSPVPQSVPKFRLQRFSWFLISDVLIYNLLQNTTWLASPPLFLHPVDGFKTHSDQDHGNCGALLKYRSRDVELMKYKWLCRSTAIQDVFNEDALPLVQPLET